MGGYGYGTRSNVSLHRRRLRNRLFPDGTDRQKEKEIIQSKA
jgi:dephospho-CoA kinase